MDCGVNNGQFLESYLTDRDQFVAIDNEISQMEILTCGVPQCSVLGLLLLLVFINDLSLVCQKTKPVLFADDTSLFFFKQSQNFYIKINTKG